MDDESGLSAADLDGRKERPPDNSTGDGSSAGGTVERSSMGFG